MTDALNQRLHHDAIDDGAPTVTGARGHGIAVGDLILTHHNDASIPLRSTENASAEQSPVRNGQRWHVTHINSDNNRLIARRLESSLVPSGSSLVVIDVPSALWGWRRLGNVATRTARSHGRRRRARNQSWQSARADRIVSAGIARGARSEPGVAAAARIEPAPAEIGPTEPAEIEVATRVISAAGVVTGEAHVAAAG